MEWPVFTGDYIIGNREGFVAIATLNSEVEQFRELLENEKVAIIGSVKTENLGIEKIIANVISNTHIRALILCGVESKGHYPGQTLKSLIENGVDEGNKIVGSKGAIPYLENIDANAVERFREQIVKVVDLIGVEDVEKIKVVVDNLEWIEKLDKEEIVIKGVGKKGKSAKIDIGKDVFVNEITKIDGGSFKIILEV